MSTGICPSCGRDRSQPILEMKNFSFFHYPLSTQDKQSLLEASDNIPLSYPLLLDTCLSCSHVFLREIPDAGSLATLYDQFYVYPSPLESGIGIERETRFFEFFDDRQPSLWPIAKSVLEIGCFDGYILAHLAQRGFQVEGCDPSRGADIAIRHGLNVRKTIFRVEEYASRGCTFDLILLRHVIEHLPRPDETLADAARLLRPGGYILLEMPNAEFAIEAGSIEIFHLEHLHGFTLASLSEVLARAGLNTVTFQATPENLIVAARLGEPRRRQARPDWENLCNNFVGEFQRNVQVLSAWMDRFAPRPRRVGIWGGGSSGEAALSVFNVPPERVACIVDGDPLKWGMEYVRWPLEISPPERLFDGDIGCVIIASQYHREIAERARQMDLKIPMIQLHPTVSLID